MKILVVDDEDFALELLTQQLAALGFHDVVTADRAKDALVRILEGENFDMVFTDLQMPCMDGVEFVRALAEAGFRGDLVLFSGEDWRILNAAEHLARVRGLRLLGSLAKPVDLDTLESLVAHRAETASGRPHPVKHRDCSPLELRRAIDQGELILHCQPKVHFDTGALIGVEMLVRWQHPGNGLVLPDQFIPVAEEHGLIDDLTHWVLVAALRHTQEWRAAGLGVPIAVNLSMDNLLHPEFADVVASALAGADVPPQNLILEVTESRVMKDPGAVLDILARLRLKRIGLSIDDFGTGHSSLAQLRDLPFTELKLDRSFVHDACRHPHQAAILASSLDMGRGLGMRCVAEGVEDRADWDFLRRRGCQVAQGYFIARPMDVSALADWLAQWPSRWNELRTPE